MTLALEKLTLAHRATTVIKDLTLTLAPGELVALVGPNGAGKSTLLRAVFGIHRPVSGTIRHRGLSQAAVSGQRWQQEVGYMPQDNAGNASLTALETVLLGAIEELTLRLTDEVLHRAASALNRFGILELSQRRLSTLSGGQRQLVHFAQALMREPKILLLDEPASALDLRHQMLLMSHVRRATREAGLVTVIVLHDLTLAANFADRLVVLDRGAVVADGAPAGILGNDLLRRVYGVEGEVRHGENGRIFVHVSAAAEEGQC